MVLHRSDGIPVDELALIKVVVLGLVQGALYRRRDQVIVAWVSGLGEDCAYLDLISAGQIFSEPYGTIVRPTFFSWGAFYLP